MAKTGIGLLIQKSRKKAGLTAEELGKKVGVGRSYVAKIENGFIRCPSCHLALAFKKALRLGDDFLELYYKETRPDIVVFFNKKAKMLIEAKTTSPKLRK